MNQKLTSLNKRGFLLLLLFLFYQLFETGFLCVTVLAVLELTLDQAGLNSQRSDYLCLPSAEIKGRYRHHPVFLMFVHFNAQL